MIKYDKNFFKNNNVKKEEKGFSLIELIVILFILAVLAAIATPLYLNQKNQARLTTAKTDGRTIEQEMTTILTSPGCTTMGTTALLNNTTFVTLSAGTLTLTYTANYNCPVTSGATYVVSGINTSTNSRIKTSGFSTIPVVTGAGTTGLPVWCFAIQNSGSASDTATTKNTAVYTQDGIVPNATSCSLDGTPS